MKKIIILSFCLFMGLSAYAMYDFCESPQDYNTFKDAYDVKTEYWKEIPNYHPDDIEVKDNNKPSSHWSIIKKSPKTDVTKIETNQNN
ncbi:hypothetical protein J6O48_10865 [bacterium]|nr:hypothetical protein [bacterium]